MKKYVLEYRIKNNFFEKIVLDNWQTYKRYKTEKSLLAALKTLTNKNNIFDYRKGKENDTTRSKSAKNPC